MPLGFLCAVSISLSIGALGVGNLIRSPTGLGGSGLATKAALGASALALRRTRLAESLLLCGTGAAIGILAAPAIFSVLARYASRFSVRGFDLTFDWGVVWASGALALISSVLLAF